MIKKFTRLIRKNLIFARNGYFPTSVRHPEAEYFGTEYGGWPVITSQLDSTSIVLSFGLGEDISFDLGIIDRFGSTVHGFDPTPKAVQFIESQDVPEQFHFHNFGLAGSTGVLSFNAPEHEGYASYSATHSSSSSNTQIDLPVKNIDEIFKRLQLDKVDVLKMDIEGSENEVIESMKDSIVRPAQILVEFHHRIHKTDFSRTRSAIEILESMGYRLFYISNLGDEFAFVHESVQAA